MAVSEGETFVMLFRRLLALLALPALTLAASPGGALAAGTQDADAYQIFARARDVWALQQYPSYMTYTVAVNVTERGVEKSKHYHLAYDLQHDKIDVNAVSDEEHAAPPTPSGFILHLQPRRQGRVLFDKKVGNPGEAVDYLGVPLISPTYDFGMSRHSNAAGRNDDALIAQIRGQYHDPMPAAKAQELASGAGPMKSIAIVTSHVRDYTVQLAGVDNIGGRACYHLQLQPLHDPQRLRLRDVWVDEQTYRTMQLVSDGNFTESNVPWLITFGQIDGAQYIASEVALAPVGVGPHRYERASVSFDAIAAAQPPNHPTGWFVTKQNVMQEPDSGGSR